VIFEQLVGDRAMSDPNPAPFDPSEFTAQEMALARDFLLLRRSTGFPAAPPEVLSVSEGESLTWRRTEQGGQARRYRCRTTTSRCALGHSTVFETLEPLGDWLDCPEPPSRSTPEYDLPSPDQVIEPPEADGGSHGPP
jgi:hypothetical protein